MDTKPSPVPSVTRNVHYVAYGTPKGEYKPLHRAAVITEVYFGEGSELPPSNTVIQLDERGVCMTVGLCVLNPTGQFFNRGVPFDPGKERCSCGEDLDHPVHTSAHPDSHDPHDVKVRHKPGTWHWPEYVADK